MVQIIDKKDGEVIIDKKDGEVMSTVFDFVPKKYKH